MQEISVYEENFLKLISLNCYYRKDTFSLNW